MANTCIAKLRRVCSVNKLELLFLSARRAAVFDVPYIGQVQTDQKNRSQRQV